MKMRAGCELLLEAEAPIAMATMIRPRDANSTWYVDGEAGFKPWHAFEEYQDPFGNHCQRFMLPKGASRIRLEAERMTEASLEVNPDAGRVPPLEFPPEVVQFTLPSRYCPSDRSGLAVLAEQIVAGSAAGYGQVEAIRAWIEQNILYRYGVSNVHTDAEETIARRAGVCRDFAHVGIALCRSMDIPARMVVGWLHGLEPMDLHAWFEAYVGGAWYAFDATQPQPKGGRIVIGHGRDAADVAFLMSYGPLKTTSMEVWTHVD